MTSTSNEAVYQDANNQLTPTVLRATEAAEAAGTATVPPQQSAITRRLLELSLLGTQTLEGHVKVPGNLTVVGRINSANDPLVFSPIGILAGARLLMGSATPNRSNTAFWSGTVDKPLLAITASGWVAGSATNYDAVFRLAPGSHILTVMFQASIPAQSVTFSQNPNGLGGSPLAIGAVSSRDAILTQTAAGGGALTPPMNASLLCTVDAPGTEQFAFKAVTNTASGTIIFKIEHL